MTRRPKYQIMNPEALNRRKDKVKRTAAEWEIVKKVRVYAMMCIRDFQGIS